MDKEGKKKMVEYTPIVLLCACIAAIGFIAGAAWTDSDMNNRDRHIILPNGIEVKTLEDSTFITVGADKIGITNGKDRYITFLPAGDGDIVVSGAVEAYLLPKVLGTLRLEISHGRNLNASDYSAHAVTIPQKRWEKRQVINRHLFNFSHRSMRSWENDHRSDFLAIREVYNKTKNQTMAEYQAQALMESEVKYLKATQAAEIRRYINAADDNIVNSLFPL